MERTIFSYNVTNGWSVREFPPLDSEQTLVLVFGAPEFINNQGPITTLSRAYPRSVMAGCSSAGEIFGAEINDGSLSVAVIRFEKARICLAQASMKQGQSSPQAGKVIARSLEAPDLRSILVFSDGLSVNGTELLGGIHSVVGPEVVVTGGLAGDGSRFKQTWVLVDAKPVEQMVTAVGFYGPSVGLSHGSRGGWDVFGPERVVTRSEGNVVYELDSEPALALYKTYLGDRAVGLPATALLFPLALRTSGDATTSLVRTILAVDEATQSMTFAGDVPQHSVVQLMRANFDRLIDGAADAGRSAVGPTSGPSISIAISCVGRRLVLGERAEEEVEATVDSLAEGGALVGFYSYGEISPLASGQCGALHNQTMTVTRIWES